MNRSLCTVMVLASVVSCESESVEVVTTTREKGYLRVSVGKSCFRAMLVHHETSDSFKKMLPLTLKMNDLYDNEKYAYLSESLPTNAVRIGSIKSGDIMIYGTNGLVIFYKDFSTSYSYTRLGYMVDTREWENVLGGGDVEMHFEWVSE